MVDRHDGNWEQIWWCVTRPLFQDEESSYHYYNDLTNYHKIIVKQFNSENDGGW